MSYSINAGIQVQDPTDPNGTWYSITDDNRQPIKMGFEVIEKTNRMADGTLRRYVVARKNKISTSWQSTWSATSQTSDGGKGMAWLRSYYEANVFVPVYLRLTAASVNTQNISTSPGFVPTEVVKTPYLYDADDTYIPSVVSNLSDNMTYHMFITSFDYEVVKRNKNFDLVNVNIEFTEI
jgi:hypothetical protein